MVMAKETKQQHPLRRPRRVALTVATLAVIGGGAVAGLLLLRAHRSVRAVSSPTSETAPGAGLTGLEGRWQRPDGGYVLEIRKVYPSGVADAAYFNPNPIRVAKATATGDPSSATVFVELQDVNYPGSTYTLTYDSRRDVLEGIYYQAMLDQRFDVVFVRLTKALRQER
jgi:hypothetical protein